MVFLLKGDIIMINIGVCDDEEFDRLEIKKYCEDCEYLANKEYKIEGRL